MLTSDLIKLITDQIDLHERAVHESVNMIIKEIIHTLQKQGRLEIRGFGSFHLNVVKPNVRRNPKTGELLKVGRRYRVIFRPAKELKLRVNG